MTRISGQRPTMRLIVPSPLPPWSLNLNPAEICAKGRCLRQALIRHGSHLAAPGARTAAPGLAKLVRCTVDLARRNPSM
jgi:hypothetical protein